MDDMQRQLIRQKLIEAYKQSQGSQDIEAAQNQADNTNLIAGIGEALSTAANANSVARGGQKADLSIYDNMRSQAKDAIKRAVEARQGKMQGALQDLQIQQGFDKEDREIAQQAFDNQYRQDKLAADNKRADADLAFAKARMTQDESQFQRSLADNSEQRQLDRDISQSNREIAREEKKRLEDRDLRVPGVGLANTPEDAKKLKDATELKSQFDRQLGEMIELRKKHGGGAILNREDVARGKQLSRDLLLTYKDLSKLGVLSAQDTAILNAIIPEDPLEYDLIPGQDPIMNRLEKFQGDAQKDYETRLKTRLQPGQQPSKQESIQPLSNDENEELKRLRAKYGR